MELKLVTSAYDRIRGDLPYLPVVNMFAEQTESEGVTLISRPGLIVSPSYTPSASAVNGLFKKDGVFNGDLFRVHENNTVLREDALLGSIDGANYVSMAGYAENVFFARGEQLWNYNGTTLTTVTVPDNPDIVKVLTGASRLIAVVENSDVFYWSDPLTTTIGALSFASAEASTDRIVDAIFLGDTLIIFGAETVEFWPSSPDDPDIPFIPLEGRTWEVGIRQREALTQVGATFAWITNRNQICMSTPENIISTPGIEQKISNSGEVRLWRFFLDGTEFLTLSLIGETWVFNTRSGMWSKFITTGSTTWEVEHWAGNFFGGDSGAIQEWTELYEDDEGGAYVREFRAYGNLNSGGLVVNNLSVRVNPGYPSGSPGSINMTLSRDGGNTFTTSRSKSLGDTGDYRKFIRWHACGMFSQPGIVADFNTLDSIPLRVSGVFVNEPYGGI